jgi:hypothetical protein
MCFQVYFKPSHRCIERELESSAKTKASTPQLILRRRSEHLSGFGIIFTLMSFTKGGESDKKGSDDSVFGDLCQRGESMSPKQKDRTIT